MADHSESGANFRDAPIVFAIGRMTISWNWLDSRLHDVFAVYSDAVYEFTLIMYHFMGGPYRVQALEMIVDKFEKDPIAKDLVTHFLKGYQILQTNRDFIMHALEMFDPESFKKGYMILRKSKRRDPFSFVQRSVNYEDVNSAADAMDDYYQYVHKLVLWLGTKNENHTLTIASPEGPKAVAVALPDKPALPRNLTV